MLKVHNTLSGQKDNLTTLSPNQVWMYVCGVTVYDECHLGHARSALVFDVIRRYLEYAGYGVTYVRNFTDVDDKIIARASKDGVSCREIVDRYMRAYRHDMDRLGIAPADVEPRATDHIPDIIRMIETLIDKGHAYRLNGDVYYEVATFPAYGRLSKRNAEDLLAGARVEVDARKRNPMDFALWKSSKPGEPAWDSPWGAGRPGWHIECSAMSTRHLGETFDIHGGGMDLIFPHHENEIAQSSAATGKEFARYWLHNGFVQINQEKMSKSLGNFFTIREVFEKWSYSDLVTSETLRYFLLATHYRSPLEFSDQGLHETKRTLDGFYGLYRRLAELTDAHGPGDRDLGQAVARLHRGFDKAMDDDFNTPAALAQFQSLRGEANRLLDIGVSQRAGEEVREAFGTLGRVVGLFQLKDRDWEFNPPVTKLTALDAVTGGEKVGVTQTTSDEEVERQVAERNEARRQKDFARADEIRTRLARQGITIEDRPDGTSRWKR